MKTGGRSRPGRVKSEERRAEKARQSLELVKPSNASRFVKTL